MPRLPPELTSTAPASDDPVLRLGQQANINEIDALGCGEWTILYEYNATTESSRCGYSALMTTDKVVSALKSAGWDLIISQIVPCLSKRYEEGAEIVSYERFSARGMEPIVYVRDFHGIRQNQLELSEEFRLFHNSYHDRAGDRYIHIDDRGNETVAAEFTSERARVLTRLLRQYMAARQLALVLFFDHRAFANLSIKEARLKCPPISFISADRCYSFGIFEGTESVGSRLVGKKILMPLPMTESGVWPYEADRPHAYEDFIVGVAADGSPSLHTCNPDALANYFGANEEAAHYLTPVWFTRDVLKRYYDNPKYSIDDGILRCGSLWSIRIDNNILEHIMVYLGDLGRNLDFYEQKYWRTFNVTSSNRKPSETNFQRSFLAQFAEPSAPDLIFRARYTELTKAWKKKFGWPIFLPLHDADAHILEQLRVPISDGIGEFDTQILYLVKMLVDSLNEAELAKALGTSLTDEKGISKFKRYLACLSG